MSQEASQNDNLALALALKEKLGISISYASELANGKRMPSLKLAAKIEDRLGIPAADWVNKPRTARQIGHEAAA